MMKLASILASIRCAIVNYNLEITLGIAAPDCTNQLVYLINGKFVGPTLYATSGDTLRITVKNSANTSTSVHLHGINQRRSIASDGAAGFSNRAYQPGETHIIESIIGDEGID